MQQETTVNNKAILGVPSLKEGEVIDASYAITEERPKIGVTHICDFLESPRHYHYKRILKKGKQTAAMADGTIFHRLVLEPDKFYQEYMTDLQLPEGFEFLKTVDDLKSFLTENGEAVPKKGKKEDFMDACRKLIVAGKDKVLLYDDWLETNTRDKIFIPKQKWDDLHEMRDSVMAHAFTKRYLEFGRKEVFIEGEIDGEHVRGRLDWLVDDPSLPHIIVIDLKKTRSAKFLPFRRTIEDGFLFVQAALYVKLLEMKYGRPVLFVWMACEGTGPKVCEAWSANEATLEAGEKSYLNAFKRLRKCRETDVWPAYTDGLVNNMDLSNYQFDRIAELESEEDDGDQ